MSARPAPWSSPWLAGGTGPPPVRAAVTGPAAGAGLAPAAACDIRIAADSAVFVPAFITIGLVPDTGASYFLARLLGYGRAFEWLAAGGQLPAGGAPAPGVLCAGGV